MPLILPSLSYQIQLFLLWLVYLQVPFLLWPFYQLQLFPPQIFILHFIQIKLPLFLLALSSLLRLSDQGFLVQLLVFFQELITPLKLFSQDQLLFIFLHFLVLKRQRQLLVVLLLIVWHLPLLKKVWLLFELIQELLFSHQLIQLMQVILLPLQQRPQQQLPPVLQLLLHFEL